MPQSIIIKPALIQDSYDIWQWRNDQHTREMSLDSVPIGWISHDNWFRNTLKNSQRVTYVGYLEDRDKIGVCRFDIDSNLNIAYVSINLNPAYRGKKLSYPLLKLCMERFWTHTQISLIAIIKKNNLGSQKCFIAAGFIFDNQDSFFLHYKKNYF